MKQTSKYLLIILFLLLQVGAASAAKFSYVYIQGDKETPFYVKLEDEMLPRYGKNYCIIPELAPGIIHIQILYQQNIYPAQNYTIVVPEDGHRGFLLTKKNDEYSLFDIQQQFYLLPSNKAEDDHAPANSQTNYISTQIGPKSDAVAQEVKPNTSAEIATTPKTTKGPEFIDVELKNNRTAPDDNTLPGGNAYPSNNTSNCGKAVDAELFDAIHKRATDKREDSRLKYLMVKIEENCFNTNQLKILTKILPNDPERYTFLKEAYPKTVDQNNFPPLESLLASEEWRGYFKLIIQQ